MQDKMKRISKLNKKIKRVLQNYLPRRFKTKIKNKKRKLKLTKIILPLTITVAILEMAIIVEIPTKVAAIINLHH